MAGGDRLVDDLLSRCTFPAPGTHVACAFSGGADSTALLLLATAAGCDVTAVHVDHGLRPTSAAEAERAAQLAAAIGVAFQLRAVHVEGPRPRGAQCRGACRRAHRAHRR
jgi:tRNA(Ile)-lysidine synthase